MTMVGSGEGLLCGGGGLSGSSASSRGSSLICTAGMVEGPEQGALMEAGRGMEMDEGGCCSVARGPGTEEGTEEGGRAAEAPGMKG